MNYSVSTHKTGLDQSPNNSIHIQVWIYGSAGTSWLSDSGGSCCVVFIKVRIRWENLICFCCEMVVLSLMSIMSIQFHLIMFKGSLQPICKKEKLPLVVSGHAEMSALKLGFVRLFYPPRRVLCVCWLVCQQHYTKTTEQISTKLRWRMGLGPLTFSVDPDIRTDPRVFFLTVLNIGSHFFIYFFRELRLLISMIEYKIGLLGLGGGMHTLLPFETFCLYFWKIS